MDFYSFEKIIKSFNPLPLILANDKTNFHRYGIRGYAWASGGCTGIYIQALPQMGFFKFVLPYVLPFVLPLTRL